MKRYISITLAVGISVLIVILGLTMTTRAANNSAASEFSCANVTEIPQAECEALVALYNSTNGPGWTHNGNWLVTNTPVNWYGVTLSDDGHVADINLDTNKLSGVIPPELGDLVYLKFLILRNNQLVGDIPGTLINLVNLCPEACGEEPPFGLNLDYNYLNVPPGYPDPNNPFHEFLQRKSGIWHLRQISPFTGCSSVIEISQSECEALIALYDSTNGSVWTTKTNWLVINTPGIWYGVNIYTPHIGLFLQNNNLSGTLPAELANLSNLMYLDLSDNQLTGSIPDELANLINLDSLNLNGNHLTGNIPAWLANMNMLGDLHLSGNQFDGSIPPEFAYHYYYQFDLSNNFLTGSIPAFGSSFGLNYLDLSHNQLTGSIPSQLGNTDLIRLDLSANQLTGSIPPELGNLPNLEQLKLDHNRLSGSLSPELGSLSRLQVLWLQDNNFSGDMPSTFTNLSALLDPGQYDGQDGLDLDNNQLNIPCGYPDSDDPLQVFLNQKDPDWQLSQGLQQVIGAGGGELVSIDGRTDFLIPAGALITDTTFTFTQLPLPLHDHFGLASAQNNFGVIAFDSTCNPVTTFNLPITITLTYTDSDFGAIPEDMLGLYYWDEAVSKWTDAVTTCPGGEYTRYPGANSLALPLCHLTEFGLFGPTLNVFVPVVEREW